MRTSAENPQRRFSIRSRLILLFVAITFVPMIVTTLTGMQVNIRQTTHLLQQDNEKALDDSINIIIGYNRQAGYLANFLANSQEIQTNLHSEKLDPILENIKDLWFMGILEIFDSRSNLVTRFFVPQSGIEWFFTPPPTPIVQRALKMEYQIDYVLGQGGMAIKASAPIVDTETMEVSGVVVVTFPMNSLLLNVVKEQVNAEVTVQWNYAGSIVSTIESLEGQKLGLIWNSAFKDFSAIENTITNQAEVIGNNRYTTAYVALKNLQNQTVAIVSTATDYSPIEEYRQSTLNTIMITAGIALFIAVLCGVLTATYFTRPIYVLVDTIRSIARGDLKRRVDISRSDEIGELAQSFNDMTAQLEIKQASLLEAEKKYRSIFENAVEGIFQNTPDGTLLAVNESMADILGYNSPAHMLDNVSDISQQLFASIEDWQLLTDELGSKGDVSGFEIQVFQNDRQKIWVSLSVRLVRGKDGAVTAFEGFLMDINQRIKSGEENKQLEAQLAQSQKMESIGTLAGGIAHDFNNILTPILGYSEMVLGDLPKESPVRAKQEKIIEAGNRAKDLVKQILTFSRREVQELRPLEVHPVVKEALKLLRASIPATIEIDQNVCDNCDPVLADPTHIHQVVMNLVTNSFHAMRDTGGVIKVDLSQIELAQSEEKSYGGALRAGSYIRLTVSDTGHGMSHVTIERIFEPYFTTKEHGEGTGLGLAVIHGIVEAYGGHIDVTSKLDHGTTFTLYVPTIISSVTGQHTETTEKVQRGSERIIVIDDEEAIAIMVSDMLEFLGYDVTPIIDCEELLRVFSAQPNNFDLILTDKTMPNMDGFELSQKILAIRPDIPIVMCTGLTEAMDDKKAKAIGIRKYMMKPFTREEVAKVVRQVLGES